jgi:hypothetical protein
LKKDSYKTIEERIQLASTGRTFWLEFVRKYQVDNTCYVILLPDENQLSHAIALKYLPHFLDKKHAKRGIVMSYDTYIEPFQEHVNECVQILTCSKEEMEALIQFYCLYEFASNIIIASLEQPSGRMGMGIVGHKNLTFEEVFAGVVYGLLDEEI